MLTADVFVNIPVKSIAKAYTYRVPDTLSFLRAGWRVLVPFGARKAEGFVFGVTESGGEAENLKEIIDVVDDEPWFSGAIMQTAKWMADFYLCSPAETMRLFMPGKSGVKISTSYVANESQKKHALLADEKCCEIYGHILAHGPMTAASVKKKLPHLASDADDVLAGLFEQKLLTKEYGAQKRIAALYEEYVALSEGVVIDDELLARFNRQKARRRLLEFLKDKPPQKVSDLKANGISAAVTKNLEAQGFIKKFRRRIFRDSYQNIDGETAQKILTPHQQEALSVILPALDNKEPRGFLLHGVTGSGKTEVYAEAVARARAVGRKAVVLVPEIALTGQLVANFKKRFKNDVIVIHSRLSVAERNDAVTRVRQNEAGIVIGARSALFAPIDDVGLIVLDEEHDSSYKQDESPRYHARTVAGKLAQVHGAVLLLGSATPSVESFYLAKKGVLSLLKMPERIGGARLADTVCVDMREELLRGNYGVLSGALKKLLKETLAAKEQAIIMLNRRGWSTFIMCRSCGEVIKCPECSMPLVYHRANGKLLCHHCDIFAKIPDVCPKCGSSRIKYFGSGTEKLEDELAKILPAARVVRMDRDTTNKKFAHREILDGFRRGEYDILLGTQMVAKGHDIQNVTAVGIISADSALNMPDFRASERSFMLITQTAGRAGRGEKRGTVVVQSYNPEHYAVKLALKQDYDAFFDEEIKRRRELFFPPFSRLVKIIFHGANEADCKKKAAKFSRELRENFADDRTTQIAGPFAPIIAKYRETYRFAILIKTNELRAVRNFLREKNIHLQNDVTTDIDPITML